LTQWESITEEEDAFEPFHQRFLSGGDSEPEVADD